MTTTDDPIAYRIITNVWVQARSGGRKFWVKGTTTDRAGMLIDAVDLLESGNRRTLGGDAGASRGPAGDAPRDAHVIHSTRIYMGDGSMVDRHITQEA